MKQFKITDGTYVAEVNSAGELFVTLSGGTIQWDDTDKMAVSLYGKDTAAGDIALNASAIGNLEVDTYPGGGTVQFDDTDKMAVSLYGTDSAAGDKSLNVSATGNLEVDTYSPITARTAGTVTCTVASTEYAQALPSPCMMYEMQNRSEHDTYWSDVSGLVATPTGAYNTMKAGDFYYSPVVRITGGTLYFASASAGDVIELTMWS